MVPRALARKVVEVVGSASPASCAVGIAAKIFIVDVRLERLIYPQKLTDSWVWDAQTDRSGRSMNDPLVIILFGVFR